MSHQSLPEASGSPVSLPRAFQGQNQPKPISKASEGLKRNLPPMHQIPISLGYDVCMETNHKPIRTSDKYRTAYSYRGFTIEKRSDGTWSYRDWSKKGATIFGNPSSSVQYYFTRLKDAVAFIDSEQVSK
jgi:hypothetical protein